MEYQLYNLLPFMSSTDVLSRLSKTAREKINENDRFIVEGIRLSYPAPTLLASMRKAFRDNNVEMVRKIIYDHTQGYRITRFADWSYLANETPSKKMAQLILPLINNDMKIFLQDKFMIGTFVQNTIAEDFRINGRFPVCDVAAWYSVVRGIYAHNHEPYPYARLGLVNVMKGIAQKFPDAVIATPDDFVVSHPDVARAIIMNKWWDNDLKDRYIHVMNGYPPDKRSHYVIILALDLWDQYEKYKNNPSMFELFLYNISYARGNILADIIRHENGYFRFSNTQDYDRRTIDVFLKYTTDKKRRIEALRYAIIRYIDIAAYHITRDDVVPLVASVDYNIAANIQRTGIGFNRQYIFDILDWKKPSLYPDLWKKILPTAVATTENYPLVRAMIKIYRDNISPAMVDKLLSLTNDNNMKNLFTT